VGRDVIGVSARQANQGSALPSQKEEDYVRVRE